MLRMITERTARRRVAAVRGMVRYGTEDDRPATILNACPANVFRAIRPEESSQLSHPLPDHRSADRDGDWQYEDHPGPRRRRALCRPLRPRGPPEHDPLLGESTVKVSDYVWAIMGWPNIGIVVGENATLVVDTGSRAVESVPRQRERPKVPAPNNKLYLTTTHFHPEHAGAKPGFPAVTHPDSPQGAAGRDG